MNVDYPPEAEQFRQEIRDVLHDELPDDWAGLGALDEEAAKEFTAWWRGRLGARGWLTPSWPREFGGAGLSRLQQVVLAEEFARAGVPVRGANDVFSVKMIGNLLLRHGTPEQQAYFLPRIVSNEHRWCQGFSEPGAGSDLASLRTRARLDERRVGHRRPEDLDLRRAHRELDVPARSHRPRCTTPRRHQHAAAADGPARHRPCVRST